MKRLTMRLLMTEHYMPFEGRANSVGGSTLEAAFDGRGFYLISHTRRLDGEWHADWHARRLSTDELTVVASWILAELHAREQRVNEQLATPGGRRKVAQWFEQFRKGSQGPLPPKPSRRRGRGTAKP